jgi:hypothetical protein
MPKFARIVRTGRAEARNGRIQLTQLSRGHVVELQKYELSLRHLETRFSDYT